MIGSPCCRRFASVPVIQQQLLVVCCGHCHRLETVEVVLQPRLQP